MAKTTKTTGKAHKGERGNSNAPSAMGSPSPIARAHPPVTVPPQHSEAVPGIYRNSLQRTKAISTSGASLASIAENEVVKILQQYLMLVHQVKVKTFSPSFVHYIVSLHDPADLETKSSIYGKVSELENILQCRIKVQFTRVEHMETYEGKPLIL